MYLLTMRNNNLISEINNIHKWMGVLNEQQLGDANNDGIVDQLDTDWVTNNWLQPGDVYDSNDGIVNLADLTLVTNNFGQGQSTGTSTGTTTGTTGGGTPICMGITAQGCPGTQYANVTLTTATDKCATIDNVQVTANDVGRDIMDGPVHYTVQSVFQNVTGNGNKNYTSAPGPCPRPNTSTGTTGGDWYCIPPTPSCVQTNDPGMISIASGGPYQTSTDCNNQCGGGATSSTCNKSCQQLAPRWKKMVRKNLSDQRNKCRWLRRVLNKLEKKLSNAERKCQIKRLKCKLAVINYYLKNC